MKLSMKKIVCLGLFLALYGSVSHAQIIRYDDCSWNTEGSYWSCNTSRLCNCTAACQGNGYMMVMHGLYKASCNKCDDGFYLDSNGNCIPHAGTIGKTICSIIGC